MLVGEQTRFCNIIMKPIQRKLLIGFMWFLSVSAAFVGGVYFRIAFYVFPSAVRSFTVKVDGPLSPDGILYSAKGIAKANEAADSLISSSISRRKNYDPRIIITPAYYGYTVHYTSGSPVVDFPEDLLKSVRQVVRDVLNRDLEKNQELIWPNKSRQIDPYQPPSSDDHP